MGDFVAHFRRPESGIHTVEGNVAGSRAAALTKKREQDQLAFEEKKRSKMATTTTATDWSSSAIIIQDKFAANTTLSLSEQNFQAQTIGLVTAEEFKRAARIQKGEVHANDNDYNAEQKKIELQLLEKMSEKQARADKKAKKKKQLEKKKMLSTLSFATEEDDLLLDDDGDHTAAAADSLSTKPKKSFKDPTVDTSFLPDKNREEEELQLRTRLALEWKERQEAMKEEKLEIVYSYWDGSGHRRTVECRKGDSIGDFLEKVRQDLSAEFRELSAISADALLYVKEDLMIPQDLTFYDLIVTKARGKSGPLFHFDVHDDLRIGAIDSRVEKDESHPGKVVERRWYDRNKHIFPASRWELFDPTKTYGSYTIHGREVNKK